MSDDILVGLHDDRDFMSAALHLARRGIGHVEPNPPVGAIVIDDQKQILGYGWHQQYGGPHAEVFALAMAGEQARGATLFVTLEPCCHFGKTPPCSQAVIAAGIRRVIVAQQDPAAHVNGGGLRELQAAGIDVEIGLLGDEAQSLTAPFTKLMTRQLPWVHAKWAMTLDGKLAASSGHSQWISNAASREIVHQLRGRMEAIVVGSGTVLADNPQLTARPPGPRRALRVVIDARARLPLDSHLVTTAQEVPVLCVCATEASVESVAALQSAGVEVLAVAADAHGHIPTATWLSELGRRRLTHVLVEGGGQLFGQLWDADAIDEVHAFVAPKLVGGAGAVTPIAGRGHPVIPTTGLKELQIEILDDNVYFHGRCR